MIMRFDGPTQALWCQIVSFGQRQVSKDMVDQYLASERPTVGR